MTTIGTSPSPTTCDPDARAVLLSLINASWTTQAISVATRLRLPELLLDGPHGAGELARMTQCDEPSIARLLRALTTIDVLRESTDGLFELAATGHLLRRDVNDSLAAWAEFCGTQSWATWGRLEQSVRSGESVRKQTTGADGFHHLEDDVQGALLFNRAMVDLTQPVARAAARVIDFSGMHLVVDIGGGHGELIAEILRQHPSLRGILFDLAHATAAGGARLGGAGVEERCALVTGSFFDSVPGEADAYLLKSVLHDWSDERAIDILRSCRRAMPEHAKLFVIERIAPERFGHSGQDQSIARSDLNMLVGTGGRERTQSEYRDLLAAAGLQATRLLQLNGAYCAIESELTRASA